MKVTQVTVSYSETYSTGNYGNVKPSVSFTATLDEGDEETTVRKILMEVARDQVRSEIDDVLEANGQPAVYSSDPRFKLLYNRDAKAIAVVPTSIPGIQLPAGYMGTYRATSDMRLAAALHRANDMAEDWDAKVYDCSDLDFSKLPKAQPVMAIIPQEDWEDETGDEEDELEE